MEATWDLCGHVRISSGPSGNSSGAHRLLSRSRQTPARKRCRAELGTFIKGLGGAGGTSKGGSHCFRPAKFIGVSRRRNASFFWASRFGRGLDSKNSAKRCVFSHPNLNLKKMLPFQAIVKKKGSWKTGGLRGAGGCSSEGRSVVGRVDERLAVEAEGHHI